MGLTQSLESIINLQSLIAEHPVNQERAKKACPATVTSDERKQLRHGLEGLQASDLIRLLKPHEAPLSVQLSVETLAFELQQECEKSKERKKSSRTKCRQAAS